MITIRMTMITKYKKPLSAARQWRRQNERGLSSPNILVPVYHNYDDDNGEDGNGNVQWTCGWWRRMMLIIMMRMRITCQAFRPERKPRGKTPGFASTRRPVHPWRSSKAWLIHYISIILCPQIQKEMTKRNNATTKNTRHTIWENGWICLNNLHHTIFTPVSFVRTCILNWMINYCWPSCWTFVSFVRTCTLYLYYYVYLYMYVELGDQLLLTRLFEWVTLSVDPDSTKNPS